jgi:hypothetical protein
MPMAELDGISQHDRGLMAVRVVTMMGVAVTMIMIVTIMVVRVVLVIAMDVRMVTSAMAMIERAHVKLTNAQL